MTTSTTVCTTIVVPTQRPLLQRWWQLFGELLQAWRARARREAELRSLEALGDATLRDIGMAERVLQRPTLSATDYERGRW